MVGTDDQRDPVMSPQDRERTAAARRDLARVEAEGEAVGTSALARAARHLGGADAPPGDAAELWGRRIGRSLGVLFAIYLVYSLFEHFSR